MSIDADKLRFLKSDLWRIEEPARSPDPRAAEEIRKSLAAMGLDLNDDATYELLQDGLTKQKFDDLAFLAVTHYITRQFHSGQNLSWQQYSGLVARSKHTAAAELIKLLDHYAPTLKSRALPVGADPYHRTILKMIIDDYDSGRLHDYRDELAVGAAVEEHTAMKKSWEYLTESFKQKNYSPWNINFYNQFYPVKSFKEMVAGMTPARRTAVFAQAGTDQTAIDQFHKDIALVLCREALKAQPEPVNKIESGHTSDHAYQFTLEELEEAGVDLNDDATYAALGFDRQTFWANYKIQVEWITKTYSRAPAKVFTPKP